MSIIFKYIKNIKRIASKLSYLDIVKNSIDKPISGQQIEKKNQLKPIYDFRESKQLKPSHDEDDDYEIDVNAEDEDMGIYIGLYGELPEDDSKYRQFYFGEKQDPPMVHEHERTYWQYKVSITPRPYLQRLYLY